MEILKYPLSIDEENILSLPSGSRPVFVGNQRGQLTLWVLVTDAKEYETRMFLIAGTGMRIPDQGVPDQGNAFYEYVGTAIVEPFVWHVFEAKFPVF